MRPDPFGALLAKEFLEAARSRRLAVFAAGFCLLGAGIAWAGSWGATFGASAGFGRTAAALVNLVLLVVPLMGLTAGSLAVAGERERGTMEFLLSLPLKPASVFWAKFLGIAAALAAALGLAFGTLGFGLALRGGLRNSGAFLGCLAATILLAAVSLGLGLLISCRARRTAPAVGAALLLWLALVFGGDLGLMGSALAVRLRPELLLASAWLNPLSLYRLLAVDAAAAGLDSFGPAGRCAQDLLGAALRPAALAGLLAWLAAALAAARLSFGRDPLDGERR